MPRKLLRGVEQKSKGYSVSNQSAPSTLSTVLVYTNSPYRSYPRFCLINEATGSFCMELALKPLLHVVLIKRKCACRLNSNKVYFLYQRYPMVMALYIHVIKTTVFTN